MRIVIYFIIPCVLLMILCMRVNATASGITLKEYIKRHYLFVVAFIGIMIFAEFQSYTNHAENCSNYERLFKEGFKSLYFNANYIGNAGLKINILSTGETYLFYPHFDENVNIEQCAFRKYSIRKNADSDTLYIEKGDHKLYVLISKPKAHWYDI